MTRKAAIAPWEAFDVSHPDHNWWVEKTGRCLASDCKRHLPERKKIMDVSEDGTVTGSIDVNALGDVEPKTPEAKAQLEALKAQAAVTEEQDKEAEKVAEDQAKADEKAAKEAEKAAAESSKEQQKAAQAAQKPHGKE